MTPAVGRENWSRSRIGQVPLHPCVSSPQGAGLHSTLEAFAHWQQGMIKPATEQNVSEHVA